MRECQDIFRDKVTNNVDWQIAQRSVKDENGKQFSFDTFLCFVILLSEPSGKSFSKDPR